MGPTPELSSNQTCRSTPITSIGSSAEALNLSGRASLPTGLFLPSPSRRSAQRGHSKDHPRNRAPLARRRVLNPFPHTSRPSSRLGLRHQQYALVLLSWEEVEQSGYPDRQSVRRMNRPSK